MPDPRRRLPQVEALVRALGERADQLPRPMVVDAVRKVVNAARRRSRRTGEPPDVGQLEELAVQEVDRRARELLTGVVNATGVLVHTNLGRAPLSRDALEAVVRVAGGYSNLEMDLATGRRGDRFTHVEPMIAVSVGAEAAVVVNNNAAAVLLTCAALASGREVVISRGELIEIGGEFRIPEVLAQSGARLREVGTTNRTHLRDYERGLGPDTALVMKVHPSNYKVVGFTAAPALDELAGLTRRSRVPLVFDAGSGLLSTPLGDEPVVEQALGAGVDLVCFSGDKLLGGPQAGIVCGRATLVAKLRTHPLMRALRPDKMTLAALASTVEAHLHDRTDELPLWRMIRAGDEELSTRCAYLSAVASDLGYRAEVSRSESTTGGGSMPGHGIPTPIVRLRLGGSSASALSAALRAHRPPVIARVEGGWVVIDPRSVMPEQDSIVADALRSASEGAGA
jgi:L-seryl-tRNA(Ser) seleniumtransferase